MATFTILECRITHFCGFLYALRDPRSVEFVKLINFTAASVAGVKGKGGGEAKNRNSLILFPSLPSFHLTSPPTLHPPRLLSLHSSLSLFEKQLKDIPIVKLLSMYQFNIGILLA